MPTESTSPAARAEWLPAERFGQASIAGNVRAYMIGKGQLTERLREVCGAMFSHRLVDLSTGLLSAEQRALLCEDCAGLFREVGMYCRETLWVYAQTIIPDSTLDAHPWLAELGDAALGDTFGGISGVARSPYEYAWLGLEHPLAARALAGAQIKPAGLWARRYRFTLREAPLLVQELFFPAIGQV
ncbi:MAG: chorismate lyase [Proteobacteria bacterium]|nr:chorismate lyase [Pseudomonadota bacterium]